MYLILFLVLDFLKISVIHSNTGQSGLVEMLIFVVLHVTLHVSCSIQTVEGAENMEIPKSMWTGTQTEV